ncbi:MAG: hypothetical protein ACOC0P_07895, partial [Planctomycetota bacterium]
GAALVIELTGFALAAGAAARCRVHLIAGGYDKGVDLTPLAELAVDLGGLYTVGAVGARLAEQASDALARVAESDQPAAKVVRCGTLDAAVRAAIARMGKGDRLLLSPGCASWDQFPNYEARGERFAAVVREVLGGRSEG